MKLTTSYRSARGFSLIELLAVVSIIVILATIVLGGISQMKKKQDAKQTRVLLGDASQKLQSYRTDNGFFPVGKDVFSEILYTSLSGDFTGRGEGDPEGEIYWRELLVDGSPNVGQRGGKRIILDAYGQSIRYRSALDEEGNIVEEAKNAEFDLWSVGLDGEPSGANVSSKLKNEQTEDDIWN